LKLKFKFQENSNAKISELQFLS